MTTKIEKLDPSLTTKLQKQLAERAELLADHQRLQKLETDLGQREAALLQKVDLNNAAQFSEITNLRLKREFIPRKLLQIDEAVAALDEKLAQECLPLTAEMSRLADLLDAHYTATLLQALRPFFATESEASTITYGLFKKTVQWVETDQLKFNFVNPTFPAFQVMPARAERVVKGWQELGKVIAKVNSEAP